MVVEKSEEVKLCKYCDKKITKGVYCNRRCWEKDKTFMVRLDTDIVFKRVKNLTHTCLHCKQKLLKGEICLSLSQRTRFKTFDEYSEGCHRKRIPIYIHIDCIKPFCESLVKFSEDNTERIEELQLKLIERNI